MNFYLHPEIQEYALKSILKRNGNGSRPLNKSIATVKLVNKLHCKENMFVDLACGVSIFSEIYTNYLGVDINQKVVDYLNNEKRISGKAITEDLFKFPYNKYTSRSGVTFYLGYETLNMYPINEVVELFESINLGKNDVIIFDIISLNGFGRRHFQGQKSTLFYDTEGNPKINYEVISKTTDQIDIKYFLTSSEFDVSFYFHPEVEIFDLLKKIFKQKKVYSSKVKEYYLFAVS